MGSVSTIIRDSVSEIYSAVLPEESVSSTFKYSACEVFQGLKFKRLALDILSSIGNTSSTSLQPADYYFPKFIGSIVSYDFSSNTLGITLAKPQIIHQPVVYIYWLQLKPLLFLFIPLVIPILNNIVNFIIRNLNALHNLDRRRLREIIEACKLFL